MPPAKALIDAGHDVLAIVGDEPGSPDQLFRDAGATGWLLRQRSAGDIAEAIVEARSAKDSGALATMGHCATEIAPALLDGPMNARKPMDVVARTISAYTGRRSIMHRG